MYHYRECGLRNVWLVNGYDEHDTPYGPGIAIHDLEGLHQDKGNLQITLEQGADGWKVAA